ncbi:MAG: hypothetical protein S4CHLAM123_14490 [Chlamydiales bacterium]|nr:hypothetical protein [Chlamydiales bacterium]
MLKYLKQDIWKVEVDQLPKLKAFWIRFLRVVFLTSKGFSKSQIQHGASSLTYYSLLAFVPVIALLIGIARGFQFEKTFENWLIKQFSEQKIVIEKLFDFADTSLKQAQGGFIAAIGISLFLWAAIKILLNIEFVMNQIWEIKKGRTLTKQFTDYLAMIFLAPLVIFAASGLPSIFSAILSNLSQGDAVLEKISSILVPVLDIIPFFLVCLLFTFLYIFIPNTKVRFVPALIAGVVTGIIYQIVQWLYLYFQIGVTKYNAVYGTFAALPLFLIWLHLSWLIILMGAKISFSIQNMDSYGFLVDTVQLNHKFRVICSLRISHLCIKKFSNAEMPPTSIEISKILSLPKLLTDQLIYKLVASKVLTEVKRKKHSELCFQPSRSIDQLTIKKVIDMIEVDGESIPPPPSHEVNMILKSLEGFNTLVEKSEDNILLKNI